MGRLYIGTFSATMGGDRSDLYVADFDAADGSLKLLQTVENPRGPSYLARHPTLPVLYAAEMRLESDKPELGGVAVYWIERDSGRLMFRQRRSSETTGSTHVQVDPSGRFVFVASLRGAGLTVFPVDGDGMLGTPVAVHRFTGGGPHPRQLNAMIHCSMVDPSGTHVLACDLGSDHVLVFRFDPVTGALTPAARPFAQTSSGSGPRHVKFHPKLPVAYVTNELDATVSIFRFSAEAGTLMIVQTVDPKPDGVTDGLTCSELAFNLDGSQVFIAVRGAELVARYAVAPDTGRLTFIDTVASGGNSPMGLALDPSGRYLLVANRGSATVAVLDLSGTQPRLTDRHLKIANPTCVLFA